MLRCGHSLADVPSALVLCVEADLPDRQELDLLSKSSSSLISPLAHSLPLYRPGTGANMLSPCLSLLSLKGRKLEGLWEKRERASALEPERRSERLLRATTFLPHLPWSSWKLSEPCIISVFHLSEHISGCQGPADGNIGIQTQYHLVLDWGFFFFFCTVFSLSAHVLGRGSP